MRTRELKVTGAPAERKTRVRQVCFDRNCAKSYKSVLI